MCVSGTKAAPVTPRIITRVASGVAGIFNGTSAAGCCNQVTGRILRSDHRIVTGSVGTTCSSRVIVADNKARDSGATVGRATLTHTDRKHRVIAAQFRRRTVLQPLRSLRQRKCRIACLGISRGNRVSLTRLGQTVHPSAVLISVVAIGGRINDRLPVRRVNRVITPAGT